MEDDDDDLPTITSIRMFEGRIFDRDLNTLEPIEEIVIPPYGGVELTILLEWEGGYGMHLLEFQVGTDERYGGRVNTDRSHSAVFRVASQQASQVTAERPRTYPIYFWWDGVPAGQRYLTVKRRG